MGSDPADINLTGHIHDHHHQAMLVAADIEDHPVAGKEVRAPDGVLDLLRRFPFRQADQFNPACQRCGAVRVFLLVFDQQFQFSDDHRYDLSRFQ
ncbi:hypothetical protein SDC9_166431 [bioreactor metagenome]|uniref:Uncharacterized protein n=1 Tax=bioreactor metagenome TaxID=1076179 RepID=A0A645FX94_9ZZZZ